MPSEIQELTWGDVNTEKGVMLIKSPKTKRYGKGERLVPIFPEIAGLLSRQQLEVDDAEVYVFTRLRLHTNLDTTAKRYVKAAGILPWSDFWNALRASRETDLMDSGGPNDACRWIGNTLSVAAKHYQLMRKEAYSGRVKSNVKSNDAHARIQGNRAVNENRKPIKSLVSCVFSTPSRTRTTDFKAGKYYSF